MINCLAGCTVSTSSSIGVFGISIKQSGVSSAAGVEAPLLSPLSESDDVGGGKSTPANAPNTSADINTGIKSGIL